MFGLEHTVAMYLLGLALVWVGVLVVCAVLGALGRFRHDWDRSFVKELHSFFAPLEPELPAATPPPRAGE